MEAGLIPEKYSIDWLNSGTREGISAAPRGEDIMNFGAKADGKADDSGPFIKAFESVEKGTAVCVSPGKYLIKHPLIINKSIVLRGSGGTTELVFDNEPVDAITIKGEIPGKTAEVTGGYKKNSTEIKLSNSDKFNEGMLAEIDSENDPEKMYTRGE